MKFSRHFKKLLKNSVLIAFTNPIRIKSRINKIKNRNHLLILNLHKVGKDDGSGYRGIDINIFINLIKFLKENFQFTSFYEIQKGIETEIYSNKPKVILSFDDGYKDFINTVHPILVKNEIRANINLIPHCIETQRPPLNVALQDYVGKISLKKLRELKIPNYSWNDNLSKYEECRKLSNHIKNNTFKVQLGIQNYINDQIGEELYEFSTPMMNKDDILQILNYHDWGSHSFYHSNMGLETDTFFQNDLSLCSKWFYENLYFKPYIYAFPNGSFNEKCLKIAYKSGYSQLLISDEDFSKINNNIHCRFYFHATSEKEMKFKSTGSFKAL